MITCPICKATIDDDSWYCDQCGTQLMFCPKCDTPAKGKRCTKCGSVLVTADQRGTQATTTNSTPTTTPQPATTHVPPQQPAQAAQPNTFTPPSGTNVPPASGSGTMRGPVPNASNAAPQMPPSEPTKLVMCDDPSKVVILKDKGLIGRTQGDYLDVFSSCPYVSGRHGQFTLHSSMRWVYTDLGSTNGSKIQQVQLEPNKGYILKKGQIIEIGLVRFQVV